VPPKILAFSFGDGDDILRAGDSAQVQCRVYQGDTPVKITWTFHGEENPHNKQTGFEIIKIGEKSSILMIDSLSSENSGNYTVSHLHLLLPLNLLLYKGL